MYRTAWIEFDTVQLFGLITKTKVCLGCLILCLSIPYYHHLFPTITLYPEPSVSIPNYHFYSILLPSFPNYHCLVYPRLSLSIANYHHLSPTITFYLELSGSIPTITIYPKLSLFMPNYHQSTAFLSPTITVYPQVSPSIQNFHTITITIYPELIQSIPNYHRLSPPNTI